MDLPNLPPEICDKIYRELHGLYMKDICYCLNHNLVWVRVFDKTKQCFSYSFMIGEHRSNRFWSLIEHDNPMVVCYRRLPAI